MANDMSKRKNWSGICWIWACLLLFMGMCAINVYGAAERERADFIWDQDGIDSGSNYMIILKTADGNRSRCLAANQRGKVTLRQENRGDLLKQVSVGIGNDWIFTQADGGYTIQNTMSGYEKYLSVAMAEYGYEMAVSDTPVIFQYDGNALWCKAPDGKRVTFFMYNSDSGAMYVTAGNVTNQVVWLYRRVTPEEDTTPPAGWSRDSMGKWYYYGTDGKPYAGLHEIDGYQYYFFEGSKVMCSSEGRYLGDVFYMFDENGHCVISGKPLVPVPNSFYGGYKTGENPSVWINWIRHDMLKPWLDEDEGLNRAAKQAYQSYLANGTMDISQVVTIAAANGVQSPALVYINRPFPYFSEYLFEPGFSDEILSSSYTRIGYYEENGNCFMILAGN